MRWTRHLVLLLLGVLVSLAVLAAGALLLLDDEDYRDALIRASDLFLDARLEINGRFSLDVSREVTLLAEDVFLRANDGSYSFSAGEIIVRQRLGSYLMTGTFWINRLTLSDVQLRLQAGDERAFNLEDVTLPPVVIEQARLHNLHLHYQEKESGRLHELSLLDLVLDDVNDAGPVMIEGAGMINGRPLEIEGQLGQLADLVDEAKPYALRLDINSGQLEARVSGAIADPVEGEGMDLQVFLKDPDLSKTLKLFNERAPAAGEITARARVSGDYDAPRLDDIEVHLQRGSSTEFTIDGKVGDLMTGSGLELGFAGHSSEPGLLSWLLFREPGVFKSLKLAGQLREKDSRFLVEDLKGNFRSTGGVRLDLSGSTEIPTRAHPKPTGPGKLALSLSSPTLAALNIAVVAGLPETGAVTARARLTPVLDGIRVHDLDASLGEAGRIHTTARGSIGFIPYPDTSAVSGVDLAVRVTSPSSAELGSLFDYEVPELGPVQVDTQLTGGASNLLAERVRLNVGAADQPVIRASGSVETALRKQTSTMKISFDVAVADLVAAFGELPPGYLGRLQGSMEVSDVDGSWGLDRFDVKSAQTTLYQVHFTGMLDDVINRDQAEIRLRAEIPNPAALGEAAGLDLADLAPYHMDGVLTLDNARVRYVGAATVGETRTQTVVNGSIKTGKPRLQGKFVTLQQEPESAAKSQHLFSREPINFDVLKKLDLDLAISVDDIVSPDMSVNSLNGRIVIQDGVLRVAPMQLVAEGGPTDLELEIDARTTPVITTQITADDQMLGRWIAQLQGEVPVDGYANYHYDLQTRGATPHELAGNLDGSVAIALENLRIPTHYIRALSVDVFGWVLGKAAQDIQYSNLDCVLARFDIKDGVATSRLLAADGPALTVEGRMKLDLGEETIDAVFLPKQKKKLFSSISPVELSGDVRNPKVTAIPGRRAITSIGPLVLIPSVAVPVILFEKLWGSVNDGDAHGGGCANLKAAKEAEAANMQQ
jgi:hypothetical protein